MRGFHVISRSGGKTKMWDSSGALQLVMQANFARQAGDFAKSLELINRAIRLAEDANAKEYVLQWKIQRALMSMKGPDDVNDIEIVLRESLEFHTQQKNTLKELEVLINLAGLMSNAKNKAMALAYLDRAEKLLSSLTPEEIDHIANIRAGSAIPTETFLSLQNAELKKIRQVASTLMGS
jgi:tetratricopeptide (TPR) repeat protein